MVSLPAPVFQTGLDVLLQDDGLQKSLKGRRVGLLAHPASVTADLRHAMDALGAAGIQVDVAFGPQHGMRGEKQDNMVESGDYADPSFAVTVFSLYGDTRRLSQRMLDAFDVLLVDLQDVGTRIYTFVTTTLWAMEDCARAGKSLWVLDRPNPAGRPIEGATWRPGYESFVGMAPLPMRHGLTLGELALWYKDHAGLDIDLQVVKMRGYQPDAAPGWGWPSSRTWVNPSPNAATRNMPLVFPGSVLLEGTHLSEGRGTTRPLETIGAPDLPMRDLLAQMRSLAPAWMQGALIRPCWFEPTFQKHAGILCAGFQVHTDHPQYDHDAFRPYRLVALFFKALRLWRPDYSLWRDFKYEYEEDRLAIDLINGGDELRLWVDDPSSTVDAFEEFLRRDEEAWQQKRLRYLIYPG